MQKYSKYKIKNNMNAGTVFDIYLMNKIGILEVFSNEFLIGRLGYLYFLDEKERKEKIQEKINIWKNHKEKKYTFEELWFSVKETVLREDSLLNEEEKNKILRLCFDIFMKYIDEFTEKDFENLGKYMISGGIRRDLIHQYGIYFTPIHLDNEFIQYFNATKIKSHKQKFFYVLNTKEQQKIRNVIINILYLLKYIEKKSIELNIPMSSLIYCNIDWKRGIIDKKTILYENKHIFIKKIYDYVLSAGFNPELDNHPEIICKLPIDLEELNETKITKENLLPLDIEFGDLSFIFF